MRVRSLSFARLRRAVLALPLMLLPGLVGAETPLRNTSEDFAECRASIREAIESYDGSRNVMTVCPGLIGGVRFVLKDFVLRGDRTITIGGLGSVLGARQLGYRRDGQNQLSVLLVPVPGFRDFWRVSYIDQRNPDEIITDTGSREYFVFMHDLRDYDNQLTYGYPYSDDTVRVLKCPTDQVIGCAVHHEIEVCADWDYPQRPRPEISTYWSAKPVLAIISETPEDREYFFSIFREVNLRAQDIIREVREISCE